MRLSTFLFLVALLFPTSLAFGWSGTVMAVHDGDTLTVQSDDGKKHRVRIYTWTRRS